MPPSLPPGFLLASPPCLGGPVSASTRDCLAAVLLVVFRDQLLWHPPPTHTHRVRTRRAVCHSRLCPGAASRKDSRRRGEGARAQRSQQKYRKPSGPQRSGGQRCGPAGVPKHPAAKLGAAREGVIWPRLIPTSAIHCPLCRGQADAPRANTRRGTARRERGARAAALAVYNFDTQGARGRGPSARLQRGRRLTASTRDPAARAWRPGRTPQHTVTHTHTQPTHRPRRPPARPASARFRDFLEIKTDGQALKCDFQTRS